MAALSVRNLAQLVQGQAAAMQSKCAQLVDFSVGSILRAVVESNAALAIWFQGQLLRVLAAARLSTSVGADADSFVNDFGLTRLPAQSAIGSVTFTRYTPTAQAVVPIGALVRSADGTQQFQVIVDPTNTAYNAGLNGYVIGAGIASLGVPVQAVVSGPAGNVLAGAINTIVGTILYVDTVLNAAALAGGAVAETDEALRVRFQAFIASLSKATIPAIVYAVTTLRSGVTCTVMENVDVNQVPVDGLLSITVDDGTGRPPGSLIAQAFAIADVTRAAGIRIGVYAPVIVTYSVAITLATNPGFDRNALVAQVSQTVNGYLDGIGLGKPLYYNQLVKTVLEVSSGILTARVAVNGQVSDLTPTPHQILRRGTVTVA